MQPMHGRDGWELVEYEYGEAARSFVYERTVDGKVQTFAANVPHAPVRRQVQRPR